jgi:hypothetical protein
MHHVALLRSRVKDKGKGKVARALTKHHAMKAHWGVEV